MNTPRPDTLRPTDAEARTLARTLMRSARYGALACLNTSTGAPLVSRVAMATAMDGAPLILVSSLAAHTGAILADPRCALLVGEPGKGDPLAHPRLSINCTAEPLGRESDAAIEAARRFLNKNPKAKLYAGLADFSWFRLDPNSASLNGGFGKAYALERADLLCDADIARALIPGEQYALDHMNEDHLDAVEIYARAFAKEQAGSWRLTGIDSDGVDMALGDRTARADFPSPVTSPSGIRTALVDLVKTGRILITQ